MFNKCQDELRQLNFLTHPEISLSHHCCVPCPFSVICLFVLYLPASCHRQELFITGETARLMSHGPSEADHDAETMCSVSFLPRSLLYVPYLHPVISLTMKTAHLWFLVKKQILETFGNLGLSPLLISGSLVSLCTLNINITQAFCKLLK